MTTRYKPCPLKWLMIYFLLFHCSTAVQAQFTNGNFSTGTGGCLPAATGWTSNTGGMAAERTSLLQPQRPGDFWLDLTPCGSFGNGTWIEQSVPMVVGNCYRIEFEIASHCGWDGSDGGVYISLDGQPLGGRIYNDSVLCVSPAQLGWKRRSSIVFTATNNPTVVRFTGEGRCRDTRTGLYPCSGPGALSNPGVIALDNIELVPVTNQPLIVSLGNDTLYCEPFTRTLDAGNAGTGTSYLWNTGATGQTIQVNNGGKYWCTVTTMCGLASDTIRIEQGLLPAADLGSDTEACMGEKVVLSPLASVPPGASALWNTGASTSAISVTQPGSYWIEISDNGCIARDTVDVSYVDIQVDLGPDRSLCDRDTPVLLTSSQPAGYHYLWSNGLSDTQLRVTRSGNYWLEISYHDCVGSDTLHIDIIPTPDVYIGPDSTICEQSPVRIGMEIPGASYRWNTAATTPYIHADQTGEYILELNLSGCFVYDTVQITAMPAPVIDLGGDRDICPDQTIILDAGIGGNAVYQWNTGATTSSIPATSAGMYGVHVTSQYHCTGGDSIVLTYYPKPIVSLPADTSVCEETPLSLHPFQLNADSLLWSAGSTGNILLVRYGGEYTVTAINKCGTAADTIEIKSIFCDIWLPNAFTPDNDGINDIFRVLGNTRRLESFGLSIFSRWGERIFHTADKYQGWDGIYKGNPALVGTYVYLLEYSISGVPHVMSGNFSLIR